MTLARKIDQKARRDSFIFRIGAATLPGRAPGSLQDAATLPHHAAPTSPYRAPLPYKDGSLPRALSYPARACVYTRVGAGARIPIMPVEKSPPPYVVNRSPLRTEEVPRLVKGRDVQDIKELQQQGVSIQAISNLSGWDRPPRNRRTGTESIGRSHPPSFHLQCQMDRLRWTVRGGCSVYSQCVGTCRGT